MRVFFRWLARGFGGVIFLLLVAALMNGSFWSSYQAPTTILAHRGLAQTFHREDLERDTCTATRIYPPEHPYLENTIASMRAAFGAGADIVEFDIHPTTDGQFAVFHDWTIDCRTEGKGVTRKQSMTYLKTLDVGYGYTADGGKTFPFRGKGVGQMPTLDEVLTVFPDRRFLINIKSNDPNEGDLLAARLKALAPAQLAMLMAYGGDRPIARLREAVPAMQVMSRNMLTACGTRYLAYGWTGQIPEACRDTIVLMPSNVAPIVWGWPRLFMERMAKVNTSVFVTGAVARRFDTSGIDDAEAARAIGAHFPGGVWTNRIDRVGPVFGRNAQ